MKPPKILDHMADLVLKYRPETKQKPPRERKKYDRRKPKKEKESGN